MCCKNDSPDFLKPNENDCWYRFRRGKRIRDQKRVKKGRETGIGLRKRGASWHPLSERKIGQ